MKMVNIVFRVADEDTRIRFMHALSKSNNPIIRDALKNVSYEDNKKCALFVAGSLQLEGPLAQLDAMFQQEVVAHSATVEIKEKLPDGSWSPIRSRRKGSVN